LTLGTPTEKYREILYVHLCKVNLIIKHIGVYFALLGLMRIQELVREYGIEGTCACIPPDVLSVDAGPA
jgi:hypothetical protein